METSTQIKRASRMAVVCYGLGDLASQFVWTFVSSYLTIFYTDIVGFAPIVVSVIMMIARIWDAINDPVMGSITENCRTRFGRFRPWIAFGCPFLAIFSVLTFVNMGNSIGGIFFSAAVYIIAGMLYTLVNIPYSSLAAVMTEDPKQRNLIGTSRCIGMNVGMIIVNSCSASLALFFSGSEVATGQGYIMTAIVYSVVAIPLFLIVFFTAKEVILPDAKAQKLNPAQTLGGMVKNKYLVILFLVTTVQMIAFMGRISITTYYVIYCLGAFALIALIMTIPSIGGIIGSLLIAPLANKIGKKKALAISFFGQGVGLFIVYFAPFDNMPMIIVGHCIYGLFNCGFPICLSMVADCVDFWEEKTGVRQDGSYYAACGLATKLGNAIGSSVGILIIAGFGYVAGEMEQTATAKASINFTVNLIPAILLILAAVAILLLWNKSDRDFDAIRARVKERNAAKKELTNP